jgi:hypothetical protein
MIPGHFTTMFKVCFFSHFIRHLQTHLLHFAYSLLAGPSPSSSFATLWSSPLTVREFYRSWSGRRWTSAPISKFTQIMGATIYFFQDHEKR